MEGSSARAVCKYVRIAPRKARAVASTIRGLKVERALFQLMSDKMKGAKLLSKTLRSAVANASRLINPEESSGLFVKEVRIDAGPSMKRGKSRSRGSRVPVLKRTSHFTIVVGD